jgi:hypothetical protein
MITDLVWQVVRGLSGKKGNDEVWLKGYLPAGYEEMVPPNHPDSYEHDKQIVEDR